ncbi:hypothetical protein SO802_021414 [Lithocarpus litseifolius]|uniref:Uncharacterized protein n=1 Tax=Lithocarpus litseifolius TaxID=425828 RepID=A0AAW2CF97_9ROSI
MGFDGTGVTEGFERLAEAIGDDSEAVICATAFKPGWDLFAPWKGSFAKSYVDIDTKQDNGESTEMVTDNGEEGVVDKGKNAVESSTTGSIISKSRKRGRAPPSDDSVQTNLSDQLKEIAVALKEINQGPADYTGLYSKVMAIVADG